MQIDLDTLPDDPATLRQMLRDVVTAAMHQHGELHAENDKLRLLIQRLLRHEFGRRSEQLSADQLQFGLEDLEQTIAENQAGQDAASDAADKRRAQRDSRLNRNHGALPAHLPCDEVVIDIEYRDCPCCGGALHVIGEFRTEQLDIIPTQLRVRVIRRPRYACRACEGAVVVAAAPERPIDGGMATEALVAHVVVSKFCDSLPLYRQMQMLARQGVTLDRSTLSNWVGRACWWLMPLYDLVVSTVLSAAKVFADDTALPVLDPGRGRTKTGRLWCYAVDDRTWCGPGHPAAAYVYSEDRKGARPAGHLGHSAACCMWTVMPGSSGWLGIVPTARCAWRSAGRICGGGSSSSMPPSSRRSRPTCWRASDRSTRSRPRSAAILPSIEDRCAGREVGRLWTHCTSGCRLTWIASPALPAWEKPSAMRSGTGQAWWRSSTTAGSRWIRTPSNGPSGR